MQLLKVPEHYKDMTSQISLTGVSVLKESKFKARHGGSKMIVQKPREGLILAKNDKLEIARKKAARKPKRKSVTTEIVKVCRPKKVGGFKINKKEVKHRIQNMVNQMKGEKRLFFWTISFPPNTSDDTAFILFNKWLTRCRRDLNLKSYLWVTERQQIGTIHFHITIHQRMCVKKANRFMRAAIFTSMENGELNWTHDAAKKYNGVDIAKDKKTKKVVNFALKNKQKALTLYLTKYVTKNDSEFQHLAYHCSRDYSNLIISFRVTDEEWLRIDLLQYLDYSEPFENEWITFYKWKHKPPDKVSQYLGFVNRIILSLINKN